jgi:hypothetical protein
VPNKTHSMTVLKRTIDEVASRGGRIIDARTRVGRAMLAWRAERLGGLKGARAMPDEDLHLSAVIVLGDRVGNGGPPPQNAVAGLSVAYRHPLLSASLDAVPVHKADPGLAGRDPYPWAPLCQESP